MGVYIKDLKKPEDCDVCPIFLVFTTCGLDRDHCMFQEVPEPHGRLIDADGISEHKYTTIPPYRKEYADGKPKSGDEIIAFKFGWNNAIDAIVENAPTIIPASEECE